MGSAFSGLSSYRRHRFKQVLSEKYSSLLQDPVTPSHFLFGDNLHEKLKKISEEQKLIKQASSVLGKNMSNNTHNFRKRSRSSQNKFQRSGSDRRRIILGNKYQRMSISRPSTNRRKKTLRPTSDWETKVFQNEWENICTDKTVLNYVKGLEIPLISKPFQHRIPDSTPESLTEFHLLKLEIDKLLQKGAIERVESLEPGSFVSRLFTVPKSNGQRRPVINLRQLNKHVLNQKFRMESLGNIRSLLKQRGFMIKIDLQDAYMLVPVAPKSRSLLVFIFDGKIYHFKVMPFGLNSAPRIFTKLFKPILRLLRSQGVLLIIYLDDILLIAPTADLCLAQGKFLMKLLQDLGGILSEHEQVSSYSHPKNNFSGFSDRLCKYDNFSPRGKTISNNSKGQFIVGSKFGLYSKPVSVCGHVFSDSPSIKASTFVLQENSTVNKQSFKQSWSKQETLLQSENSTELSGSSELAVVGRRNATPLLSSSIFPTSRCENSNRLIFPGLGCNYGACQNSRSLGMGQAVVPHKQERTADLFHCSGIFCFLSKRHSCSAVSGQYCCCKLSESCGGDKVTSFVDLAIAI